MNRSTCYVYFSINGDFNPNELKEELKLPIFRIWNKSDLRRDGKEYGFSNLSICKNENYNPNVYVMIETIIKELIPFTDYLKEFKKKHDVKYFIVVVPSLYLNTVLPSLFIPKEVIKFCNEIEAEIDIDQYLYK